jgi:hypothetical protein
MAQGNDRVLDNADLRGSVRNQVRGDADGGGGAPVNTRRRSTGTGGRLPPSLSQPPADPSSNLGFGERSTGALEWKLGPASEDPVPAR